MSVLSIVMLALILLVATIVSILLQNFVYMLVSTLYKQAGYIFSKLFVKYIPAALLLGNFVVAFVVAWRFVKIGSLPFNQTIAQTFKALALYGSITVIGYMVITQAFVVIVEILNDIKD